jgi:hypothetical protein
MDGAAMTTPLVKQIAKAVSAGLKQAKAVEAATLVRDTPGVRTAGNLAAGTNPTTTSFACSGFVSDEKHDKIGETVVDKTHLIVCLTGLGDTVPTSNDRVTIGGVTFPIADLEGNPALWTIACKK